MTNQVPLFEEIGDPQLRREEDFYESATWQVEALIARVLLRPSWRYLEPCAGDGAIARRLQAHGLRVKSNDIIRRDWPLDYTWDARDPGSWALWRREVDAVITNVAFGLAFEILPHAVGRVPLVATILRSTWDEPTEDREEWLALNPPTAQIAMPRHNYRGTPNTDSATHHWFIWADPGVVTFHHSTVTRRERDELIARWGK